MTHYIRFLFSILIIIVIACSKKEPEPTFWDNNKIEVNGVKCEDYNFIVPANGGVFVVTKNLIPNYAGTIVVNNELVWPPLIYEELYDIRKHVIGEWYDIYYDDNRGIVVELQPNETKKTRTVEVNPVCGNHREYIILVQPSKQEQ